MRQKVFLASSASDSICREEEQKRFNKKHEDRVSLVPDEIHNEKLGNAKKVPGCKSCQNDEVDAFHRVERKLEHSCLRVNGNATTAGALRYALHLRFLCPFSKKSSTSVSRSNASLASERSRIDIEGQRRFYLYDNLKVVFPQRHSDADEGKVVSVLYPVCIKIDAAYDQLIDTIIRSFITSHVIQMVLLFLDMSFLLQLQLNVEYHFPEDPKYFDISS